MADVNGYTLLSQQAEAAQQQYDDALLQQQQAAQYAQQASAQAAQMYAQAEQLRTQAEQPTADPLATAGGVSTSAQTDGQSEQTGDWLWDTFAQWAERPENRYNGLEWGQLATAHRRTVMDNFLKEYRTQTGQTSVGAEKMRRDLEQRLKPYLETKDRGLIGGIGDLLNEAVDAVAFDAILKPGTAAVTILGHVLTDGESDRAMKEANDAVARWEQAWAENKSERSQDLWKEMEQAEGFSDTVTAIVANPLHLPDKAVQMLGSLLIPGAGAASKAHTAARLARGATAARGAATASRASTIADDVAQAAAQSWWQRAKVHTGRARDAVVGAPRRALEATANAPFAFPAAAEFGSAATDVLRAPGTFNETTGQYTDDTIATAATAGLASGALTWAFGRFGGTAEGVIGRGIRNAGTRQTTAELREQAAAKVLQPPRSLDDLVAAASDDIAASVVNPATREAIQEARDWLATSAAKQALDGVAKGSRSKLWQGLKGAATTGAFEGAEEGLVAMVGSVAVQGIGTDGQFNPANVDPAKVMEDVWKAAAVGATLGGLVGGVNQVHTVAQDRATLAAFNTETAALREQYERGISDISDQLDAFEAQQTEGVSPTAPVVQSSPFGGQPNVAPAGVEVDPLAAPPTPTGEHIVQTGQAVATPVDPLAVEQSAAVQNALAQAEQRAAVERALAQPLTTDLDPLAGATRLAHTAITQDPLASEARSGVVHQYDRDARTLDVALNDPELAAVPAARRRIIEQLESRVEANLAEQTINRMREQGIPVPDTVANALTRMRQALRLDTVAARVTDRYIERMTGQTTVTVEHARKDGLPPVKANYRRNLTPETLGVSDPDLLRMVNAYGPHAKRYIDVATDPTGRWSRGQLMAAQAEAYAEIDRTAKSETQRTERREELPHLVEWVREERAQNADAGGIDPDPKHNVRPLRGSRAALEADTRAAMAANGVTPEVKADAARWSRLSPNEQSLEVEARTRDRFERIVRETFGQATLDEIVWVSPSSLEDQNHQAFVIPTDPRRVYIVLHPDRDKQGLIHSIAHEQLHRGLSVHLRGKVVATHAEYRDTIEPFMSNQYVGSLMSAMSYTYKHLDRYALAEEALAEIHAANTTGNWSELEDRWGVDRPPASLTAPGSVVGRLVAWFKALVSALTGRRRTSDAQLLRWLNDVTTWTPEEAAQLRTPDEVEAFAQRISFDAALRRSRHYNQLARQADPDFDRRTDTVKRAALGQLALSAGDRQAQVEFGIKTDSKPFRSGTVVDEIVDRQAAEALARAAALSAAGDAAITAEQLADRVVSSVQYIRIYDALHATTAEPDARPLRGVISFRPNGDLVTVLAEGGPGREVYRIPAGTHRDPDAAMQAMRVWFTQTYGSRYEMTSGSHIPPAANTVEGQRVGITPREVYIAERIDRSVILDPRLQKWVDHLKRYMPTSWQPIMDKLLDWLELAYIRFVNYEAILEGLERHHIRLSGQREGVVSRYRQQRTEADAFLHREGFDGHWTFKDGLNEFYDAVRRSGLSVQMVERHFRAMEEHLRYPELLEREGVEVDGRKRLLNPSNPTLDRATVTGFRFADGEQYDPKQGSYDRGAERYFAWLAQQPQEVRTKLDAVTAAWQAWGDGITDLLERKGIITAPIAQARRDRGFFLSMRDDTTSAYNEKPAHGRSTVVKDPIANTIRVWAAEVDKAFTEGAWREIALMLQEAPSEHFAINPVAPKVDKDGAIEMTPDGWPVQWVRSDKAQQVAKTVMVNGQPMQIVAKTKQAAAALEKHQPGAYIRQLGRINHVFNQFKTGLSPGFILPALVRDMATTFLNIEGAIGPGFIPRGQEAATALSAIRYGLQAMPGIVKGTAVGGQYNDVYMQVFRHLGAGMFFGDQLNTGAFRDDLSGSSTAAQMLTTHNPLVKGAKRVAETVSYPPDTLMRYGAMRAYLELKYPDLKGRTPTTAELLSRLNADPDFKAQLIMATKRLTVNFQQHGSDNTFRFLFSFLNAVLQGSFDTLPRILRSQHGRRSVAYASVAMALAAAQGIEEEDEDAEGNSEFFSTINRHRTIRMGDYQLPIADELTVFNVAIQNAVGVLAGKRNVMDAGTDTLSAVAGMVTPTQLGQTDNSLTNVMWAVTPTLIQPTIALTTGKDIFGQPLKREHLYVDGKRVADATDVELTTGRASGMGRAAAEAAYGLTGGVVDVSGDEVDVLGQAFLGGLYTAVKRVDKGSDELGDVPGAIGDALTAGFQQRIINRSTQTTWDEVKRRIGVSIRHEGGMLDVMDSAGSPLAREAQTVVDDVERQMKAVRSPSGYNQKQLYDQREIAERSQNWSDVRELNEELKGLYNEQDRIKADGIARLKQIGAL